MTAAHLLRLIEVRHSGATCVPACKMGRAGSRVMDAWVLLPTWSPMTTIGYEIKVSRSDWLQDQKFEVYRAACHLFLIVAPKGVVQAGELPAGVGLLEPVGVGDGQRLVMRVKPARQVVDHEALSLVMAHALMWRKDDRAGRIPRDRRADTWATWVRDRQKFRVIGRSVSARMRALVTEAEQAAMRAEARAEQLEEAARVLADLGIQSGHNYYSTRQRVQQAVAERHGDTLAAIARTQVALAEMQARVEQAMSAAKVVTP